MLLLHALFRLAFAPPSGVSPLSLQQQLTRWLILLKARRQGLNPLRPVVSTRFQVLFHSPYRGSFHLSFTVLVHYRSPNVFSLGRWTSQLPAGLACPAVLRCSARTRLGLQYGAVTLSGRPSQTASSTFLVPCAESYNPPTSKLVEVWAFPRSLATTKGIISFPGAT